MNKNVTRRFKKALADLIPELPEGVYGDFIGEVEVYMKEVKKMKKRLKEAKRFRTEIIDMALSKTWDSAEDLKVEDMNNP